MIHDNSYHSSTYSTSSFDEEKLEQPKTFGYMNIESVISNTKYPIYKVKNYDDGKYYALKVFPYVEQKETRFGNTTTTQTTKTRFYENEKRFIVLNHPNIIAGLQAFDHEVAMINDQQTEVSCIVMEYASKGNLFSFIKNYSDHLDEKLTRTLFHQLINGIEYLHQNGVCHLDLKPENILIGDDYKLKIIDFDTAWVDGDKTVLAKGTKYKRAPELIYKNSQYKPAADVFSAAIILFLMKTGGKLPQAEEHTQNGINLYTYMQKHNDEFWKIHTAIQKREQGFFSSEFKEVFNMMVVDDQFRRASINQIKETKWYKGEIYTEEECAEILRSILPQEEGEKSSNYYDKPQKSFEDCFLDKLREEKESKPYEQAWEGWQNNNEEFFF